VILYPDDAVVSAQDPGDPKNTVGAMCKTCATRARPFADSLRLDDVN